jgi:hypothetical protein
MVSVYRKYSRSAITRPWTMIKAPYQPKEAVELGEYDPNYLAKFPNK